jgi:hypothetical protein
VTARPHARRPFAATLSFTLLAIFIAALLSPLSPTLLPQIFSPTFSPLFVPARAAAAAETPATPPAEIHTSELARRSLPPVGRSLFDFLVARQTPNGAVLDVPYPFPALVAHIESRVVPDGVKTTLFPLGRSLQRAGGGPDFFHSPRLVLAVTGEVRGRAEEPILALTDRLFVGYQPKLDQLEVISYNEAAGRFEFQAVKDYAEGKTPRVVYVDRTLCKSCHQSESPIFSRPPWSETPANRHIEAMLLRVQPSFHGVAVQQGFDVPNAFDDATDRAGMFSTWQALWTGGCQPLGRMKTDARKCRAKALLAMLQYRLSPASLRGADPSETEASFAREIDEAFAANWPDGLAIPDVDVPNRDPLVGELFASGAPATRTEFGPSPERRPEEIPALAKVDPVLEPGNVRGPREVWHGISEPAGRPAQVINGLASFFTQEDVRELDRRLAEAARDAEVVPFDLACTQSASNEGRRAGRALLVCEGDGPAGKPLRFTLSAEVDGSRITGGTLRGLDAGPLGRLGELELVPEAHDARRFGVRETRHGLTARFSTGDAVSGVFVRSLSKIQLEIRRDFGVLAVAVERARDAAHESLSDRPLRRAALLRALHTTLGGLSTSWCCEAESPDLPEPQFGVP